MYRCKGRIPELETRRLLLRKMRRRDAAQMFEWWSDREVTRYMNLSPMLGTSEAADMIALLNQMAGEEEAIRWGIELKATGRLIGSCGYNTWQLGGAFRGEIGYELGREHWRQGYMTEAFSVLLPYGYETMGLNRIEALVDPRNEASGQFLSHQGFTREGLLRQYQHTSTGYKDMDMYSLLYDEWLRNGTTK
ncbi:GNAT family protein [Paenibacillus sp. JJ-223]|uniref:GNAT family N-acetyltransferase n=1 Tax=Paenibacillus sp. JJ-223 TaxID=2905647 RepID=UPI001F1CE4E0|nr:GNAT family protein [Paenibacillus sp. JJ-223]CAH1222863.1 IS1595 family transposase ISSpgl1 [Paenibacillus sp. JJ-223]